MDTSCTPKPVSRGSWGRPDGVKAARSLLAGGRGGAVGRRSWTHPISLVLWAAARGLVTARSLWCSRLLVAYGSQSTGVVARGQVAARGQVHL